MSEHKNLIYLFGFSSRNTNQLNHLLPAIKEQIKLGFTITFILLHDGIIGISKSGQMPDDMNKLLAYNIQVYALVPDIIARGLDPKDIDERVQCIEYNELADFLVEIPKVISWM